MWKQITSPAGHTVLCTKTQLGLLIIAHVSVFIDLTHLIPKKICLLSIAGLLKQTSTKVRRFENYRN